jgi:hypothetical protein
MQLGMAWIDVLLGLLCLLAGMYPVALLIRGRAELAPAVAHAAMGMGMAAMFVPAADPLPAIGWTAVFLAVAAWFAVAGLRAGTLFGEAGHHAVGAVAMIYMLQGHVLGAVGAVASGAAASGLVEPEHAHHGGGAAPSLLMTAIALAFVAWFVADLARLFLPFGGTGTAVPAGAGPAFPRSSVPVLLDRHVTVPKAVMSAGMAFMFLTMV